MPTTILTGRSLTLTIDSDTYTGQVTSAVASTATNQITVETLAGREYKTIDSSSTLTTVSYTHLTLPTIYSV